MPGGLQLDAKAWTPEEDHVILEMHAQEGPKWSQIVQALPGRTISSVRNRWQRLEKGRKLREAGLESRNRCHACGKPKRGHICYAKARGGPQVTINNPITKHPPSLNAPTIHGPMRSGALHGPTRSGRRHTMRVIEPDFLPALTSLDFLPALATPEVANDYVNDSPVTVVADPPATLTVDLGLIRPPAVSKKVSFSFDSSAIAAAPELSFFNAAESDDLMDVADAPAAALAPTLTRSNTSFFNALADSAVFTPSTKALFDSWASAEQLEPPALSKENTSFSNTTEPPQLLKDISMSQLAPPMSLQRSFDTFSMTWPSASPGMVRLTA